MKLVADHLQRQAVPRAGTNEGDLFGRSAFNRYYYSAFLIVRNGLSDINRVWHGQNHAGVPALLNGQVSDELRRIKSVANRRRDWQLVNECAAAISAASDLSRMLEIARTAREAADYNPEILVSFSGDRFSLNSISITDAHDWPVRAGAYMESVMKVLEVGRDL